MTGKPNILQMTGESAERDFSALKSSAGIAGIIHRASQGSFYIDPFYRARAAAARDAGLLFGAYHVIDGSNANDQAEFFLECSGFRSEEFDAMTLLLAVRYEALSEAAALHQLMAFVKTIDLAKPRGACVINTGEFARLNIRPHIGGHQQQDMIGLENFFGSHPLWLSEPNTQPGNLPWPWRQIFLQDSTSPNPAIGDDGVYSDAKRLTEKWL